ncbi:unnamed protein product [Paramecium primaurelia]|uniref:Uncharacterized protein n=1 Tax=Paramecium primaurelia TaxID=5886 RepID=A0A8S1Q766_PARPR|nr:unnamed protein product [Paramecium primaurelia]
MKGNQLFEPQIVSKQHDLNEKKISCSYPDRLIICYDQKKKIPIPLQGVHYFLKVLQGLVIVEIQQIYSTLCYQQPIEVEYLFSINQNAAVTKMIVELGDNKVYGIIKEKVEAKQEYEEGIKQGKTMAYSEEDEQIPEIKRVKIGALAPQKQLKILFEYIQPLDVFLNKFWKVEVSPMIDQNYLNLQFQEFRSQSQYLNRVNRYIQKYVQIDQFDYNFKQDISVQIDIGSPITYYKCPTHSIVSCRANNENVKSKMEEEHLRELFLILEDTPSNFIPKKQFTLLFSSDDINLPRAILSHTNNDALFTQKYCATLSFIPKFNQTTLDDAYSQYLDGLNIAQNQFINRGNYLFFIDRSGSMAGSKIYKAKQSLILFLKSLPEDCRFNIISFGTKFESLWSDSIQYSQDTLEQAINHVYNMEANMLGTEILRPLSEIVYNKSYGKSKTTTLNIFLLTDGEVEATPIIDLVKKNNQAETRIYTLGIGQGCSQNLIKRLAEVGNGKFQFVSDIEDINAKVIDLLEDSLTPYLKGFNLETNICNITQIVPNPESIVCLKKNQELTIQAFFSIEQEIDNLQFTLSCFDPQDQKPIKYSVTLNLKDSQENEYFHKLASHKFITYYENSLNYGDKHLNFIKINKEKIQDQDIINTSIAHQILSTKTAFVCEVCELDDQLKQQMKQKVCITQNKVDFEQDNQHQCLIKRLQIEPLLTKPCLLFFCSGNLRKPKMKEENYMKQQINQDRIVCQYQDKVEYLQQKEMNTGFTTDEVREIEQKKKSRSRERERERIKNLPKIHTHSKEISAMQIIQIQKIEYEQIISYAKADGSFQYDEKVEQNLNFEGWKNSQNYPQNIWLTLLALLYLDLQCSQNRKSWQLVYQKGIRFLQKNDLDYKQFKEAYQQLKKI